jgi:DNA-directed RNA polymerase subunit RPC12/RpoP
MPPTAIVECNKCSGLFLAAKNQRTRTCPYCGNKVNLQKAKKLTTTGNAIEASAMLRKLKAERQSNPHKTENNQSNSLRTKKPQK